MSAPLPQSTTQAPAPPSALPTHFKNPPKAFTGKPLPKGTKPGQQTSPYRINPPVKPPPPAVAAAPAAAGGIGVGSALATIGGAVAIVLLFDEPLSQDQANVKMQPPEPAKFVEEPDVPFKGGQGVGIPYRVYYDLIYLHASQKGVVANSNFVDVYGPVEGIVRYPIQPGIIPPSYIRARDIQGNRKDYNITGDARRTETYDATTKITRVVRASGEPDNFGDPPPTNEPSYSSPGNNLGAPSAAPPSAAPTPAPSAPSSFNSPGSSPKGFSSGAPSPAPLPNPGPVPQPQPQLQKQPDPSPEPFPFAEPAPKPGLNLGAPPGTSPSPTPAPAPAPKPGGYKSPPAADPTKYPDTGFQPNIFTPNPLAPSPGLTPNPLEPKKFAPNPNTGNPEPNAPPKSDPPKTPAPAPAPNDDLFKQIQNLIGPVTITLAGITALVQPNAIKSAANAATCEAFAPGGCAAPVANNAQNAANNSAQNNALLKNLLAFLEALQAAFLIPIKAGVELVNTKLGPLMAGANGISGFLGRLSNSLGVDRALNLIAIAANLHNAMMLSASLKITLLEVLSSVGNATGLLQTSEGDNVDLNAVFNQGIEKFATLLIGEENYAGLKVGLRKYSAIYRSATNVISNVGNMFSSIGNGIEVIGERTGKIGNAIRAAGMVRENAYNWMAEKMNVHTNRFMTFTTTVGGVTEVLEAINEVAESTIEGQQAYTEAVKATAEFQKQLAESEKNPGVENKLIAEEAAKIKENVSKDPTGEKEEGYLSFLTD